MKRKQDLYSQFDNRKHKIIKIHKMFTNLVTKYKRLHVNIKENSKWENSRRIFYMGEGN